MEKFSLIPHHCQHELSLVLLILAVLTGVKWNTKVILISISLMAQGGKYFLVCQPFEFALQKVFCVYLKPIESFGFGQFLEFIIHFEFYYSIGCEVGKNLTIL